MKADVHALKRPARETKTFVLKQGDWQAVFTLRRLGVMSSASYTNRANDMYAKYVTGSGPMDKHGDLKKDSPAYVKPRPLPAVDGQPVDLDFNTCLAACAIERQQVGDPDEFYTFEEICVMADTDELAEQLAEMYRWIQPELSEDEDDGQGNPPSTSTAALSITA